ncbi:TPA: dimethyl sulfoxide reductase anchor subunit family protein [Providencia rettgeri]|uniref:DmsC/YnfH family molybdoenzyme membrane anchor subunit n=1 Tax=Providencia TaxID=586 RepID=UPI001B370336|nr:MULTISPECIES: DmsC/YnfH family molybdoenzyme membrane anchor subunit [Providencia]MBQ0368383.1 dimethyl sulfoxide reductase anchor subunit family protein [Providencia rettgeri]HBC7428683.1 dimethyl sulfoxide reductase anchor subunit family protein [Providencia rettgeri]
MGAGLHEYPLIFFTVIGQSVAGAFILMALVLLMKPLQEQHHKIVMSMFGLWALMGIGFLLSMLHMGSPMRAFNSMIRVGHSALSNEIVSGSIFFALGGIYWLLSLLKKMPKSVGTIWLIVTIICAAIFIYAISRVYQIDTVPTWFNHYGSLQFILTSFIAGPVLAAFLLRIASYDINNVRFFTLISIVAVIASSILVTAQGFELGSIQSSVQKASELVPDYASLMGWRTVCLTLGLAFWIYPHVKMKNPPIIGLLVAVLLVIFGELIGRGIFYGLHMTVGMAIAG